MSRLYAIAAARARRSAGRGVVTFGHLLHEPLYPFHEHVIPRLALLVFVLTMPRGDDRFSLDHLVQRRARPAES